MQGRVGKILRKLRTFTKLYRDAPNPLSVTINLTNKCNQRCLYCEIGRGLAKTDRPLLTAEDVRWVIDEMAKIGIRYLCLGGGEPLMFDGVAAIVRYACDRKIATAVVTNGMLLPSLPQGDIETFKECKTTLFVSIDSFNEETQERIRGVKNALPLALEGIKAAQNRAIPVVINVVLSIYNYKNLFDLVVKAQESGVASVNFQPVIPISNFPGVVAIDEKAGFNIRPEHLPEVMDQLERILIFERKTGTATNAAFLKYWLPAFVESMASEAKPAHYKKVLGRLYCYVLYSDIAINHFGELMPCNMLSPCTSLKERKGKGLLELWNTVCGPARMRIKNGDCFKECRSCVCGFTTNLKASMFRYPLRNRVAIAGCLPTVVFRSGQGLRGALI